jgi:tripartite-type tricarboxylate transporter receptor subunit TctC
MQQIRTMNAAAALLAAVCLAGSGVSAAQDYPTRPIRLVNPYAPGGSTDLVVRTIGQKLNEAWGQPVVIENRPGAASNIGNELVAKAAPDGYTLLNATSSLAINVSLYRKQTYDPVKDLAPVITLTQAPNVLAVHPSLPVNTVKELIALARAKPGQLSYGSSGSGATNHLAMEQFKSMAKVDLVHVPYKGGGPAMTDLIGGQIQVLFNPASSLMPHHKAGKMRVLAIGSSQRVPDLNLPTVAEAGLPGFESSVWFALFVPAGTPQPVIAKLNGELNRILKDKRVVELFTSAGLIPVGGTPEQLAALLGSEIKRWARVVKDSGAKVD